MEADRTDPPSGKSRVDCVLPDMPPGDPPLQDTAITFRQDCEQRFAKAGLLGVAKGEWDGASEAQGRSHGGQAQGPCRTAR